MNVANRHHTRCQDVLLTFEQKAFSEWQGLPEGCKYVEVAQRWPIADEGTMMGSLGSDHFAASYDYHRVASYEHPVRVWHVQGNVIEMDVEDPFADQSASRLLKDLGEPESKTDVRYGFGNILEGEWIFGRKGLSILYIAEEDRIQALAVYRTSTPANYSRFLRIDRGSHPIPRPGGL